MIRVRRVERVVMSVSSRAVRQVRHGQNAWVIDSVSFRDVTSQVEFWLNRKKNTERRRFRSCRVLWQRTAVVCLGCVALANSAWELNRIRTQNDNRWATYETSGRSFVARRLCKGEKSRREMCVDHRRTTEGQARCPATYWACTLCVWMCVYTVSQKNKTPYWCR